MAVIMKKCVIVPDSFKGTLSSTEFCTIVKKRLLLHFPDCRVITIPVADGGEGTVDCFLHALSCEKVPVTVHGPYGEPCHGYYARQGNTGILEMAMFAGLPQVEGRANPAATTTYGVGEAILSAIGDGCDKILLGLGGSCTNDGGCGMAAALGVRFYDPDQNVFVPTGETLIQIAHIDTTLAKKTLANCQITAMCDIDHPLFGKSGAAFIFAPQKGADEAMVQMLDTGLRHLAEVIQTDLKKSVAEVPGAGAAGGMGAGLLAFLEGKLNAGIEAVLEQVGFDHALHGCDLVITGEGKIDSQSLRGKVVIGVANHARREKVPVLAIVGSIGEGAEGAYESGVTAICSINQQPEDFSISRYKSRENLAACADNIFRLWKAAEQK